MKKMISDIIRQTVAPKNTDFKRRLYNAIRPGNNISGILTATDNMKASFISWVSKELCKYRRISPYNSTS